AEVENAFVEVGDTFNHCAAPVCTDNAQQNTVNALNQLPKPTPPSNAYVQCSRVLLVLGAAETAEGLYLLHYPYAVLSLVPHLWPLPKKTCACPRCSVAVLWGVPWAFSSGMFCGHARSIFHAA
ncbi:unnamed protein product, partial [Discosporangium mesarthrocarpum]